MICKKEKKLLGICLVFLFSMGFSCFANDFKVWIAPRYTLKNGGFKQDVMLEASGGDKIQTSQTFDEDFLSYIGLGAGFGWRFILLDCNFNWGIPKSMGTMTMNRYNYGNQDIIYEHDDFETSLDPQNFDFNSRLCFDIPIIQDWLNVRPFFAFSYTFAKESASFESGRRGYSENYDYRQEKHSDKYLWDMNTFAIENGKDVWFKRELYNFNLGAEIEGTFFNHFFLNVQAQIAPVTFLNSIYYNGTGTYYLDMYKSVFSFWYWSVGIGGGARFGKNNSFEAGINWLYNAMASRDGDSYQSTEEKSNYSKYTDGTYARTEYSSWQLTIYGKYTFTFGPTHTQKSRPAREKKEKTPKVRNGKVKVKTYD